MCQAFIIQLVAENPGRHPGVNIKMLSAVFSRFYSNHSQRNSFCQRHPFRECSSSEGIPLGVVYEIFVCCPVNPAALIWHKEACIVDVRSNKKGGTKPPFFKISLFQGGNLPDPLFLFVLQFYLLVRKRFHRRLARVLL